MDASNQRSNPGWRLNAREGDDEAGEGEQEPDIKGAGTGLVIVTG